MIEANPPSRYSSTSEPRVAAPRRLTFGQHDGARRQGLAGNEPGDTHQAELTEHREAVGAVPVLDDLPVAHPNDVHDLDDHRSPAGSAPQAGAGSAEGLAGRHQFAVGEHVMDLGAEIGKDLPQ